MLTQSEKSLRRFPLFGFGILLLILGIFILGSYSNINRTLIINAKVSHLPVKTYQRVDLGTHTFITGLEGQIFRKPSSFKEAFILKNLASGSSFNLVDILYLFILNCILFWMFHDIKQDNFFNKKILIGIRLIGPLIVLYGAIGMLKTIVSNHFLSDITNGQFQSPSPEDFSLTPYIVVMLFIQAIPIFITRAQKIQQEQSYTV